MTIAFDFDVPEQSFFANAVAPATQQTLATVPLASAPFPLQSGRVVRVEAEAVGFDSNGGPLGSLIKGVIAIGTENISNVGTFGDEWLENVNQTLYLVGTGTVANGTMQLILDGSGNLLVLWNNQNASGSGVTQDVAVRLKLRWVGA